MCLQQLPVYWKWFYYANPLSYVFDGIIGSQLGDVNNERMLLEDGSTPIVSDFINSIGIYHSFVGYDALILVGWILFFMLITFLGMKGYNLSRIMK